MNPQWNAVLTTSNTIPKRSFDSSDSAICAISISQEDDFFGFLDIYSKLILPTRSTEIYFTIRFEIFLELFGFERMASINTSLVIRLTKLAPFLPRTINFR